MKAYLVEYHHRVLEIDAHDLADTRVNQVVIRAVKKHTEPSGARAKRRRHVNACWERALTGKNGTAMKAKHVNYAWGANLPQKGQADRRFIGCCTNKLLVATAQSPSLYCKTC